MISPSAFLRVLVHSVHTPAKQASGRVSSNANQAAELAHQEAALQAPAPVFVRPAGVTFRTTLKFEVTNLDALPKIYVTRTVNEVAIRSTCCTGWKEGMALPIVPGIRFYAQKDPITARR